MLGAPARETCTLLRETLPRTLSQTFTGAAASFRASSAVRRRSTRVCAQYAASCEVLSDPFHPVSPVVRCGAGRRTTDSKAQTARDGVSEAFFGAGARGPPQIPAELCPGARRSAVCSLTPAIA